MMIRHTTNVVTFKDGTGGDGRDYVGRSFQVDRVTEELVEDDGKSIRHRGGYSAKIAGPLLVDGEPRRSRTEVTLSWDEVAARLKPYLKGPKGLRAARFGGPDE